VEVLIEEWSAATSWCQRQIGQPTESAVNWQPFNRSHSIAAIFLHLADVEGLWIEEHLVGHRRSQSELKLLRCNQNRPTDSTWANPPNWTLREYLDILTWVRQRSIAALRSIGDPDYVFQGPEGPTSVRAAVRHLSLHEAYHIGQAVLHDIHHGWNGVEPA